MNFNDRFKALVQSSLRKRGKRLVNFHAPAKGFEQGAFFLKQFQLDPGLIIDVGVADGTPELWSAFPLKEYDYLLVEANPYFFEKLETLRQEHQDTVRLEKSFCGAVAGVESLSHNKASGQSSSKYSRFASKEVFEVSSKTLDQIVAEHKLKDRSNLVLKVDVEGAELDVLQGAKETLKKCSFVILETWITVPGVSTPSTFANLVQEMHKNNFSVFDFFGGSNHPNGLLGHLDTVFIRNDLKPSLFDE